MDDINEIEENREINLIEKAKLLWDQKKSRIK